MSRPRCSSTRSRVLAIDTETHLIKPGVGAPKLVCLSTSDRDLLAYDDALDFFDAIIRDPDTTIAGHHIPYDLGVLCAEREDFIPLVFDAIDHGRIKDTMLRQMIMDNAEGQLKFIEDDQGDLRKQDFSLARLTYRHTKQWIKKGQDTWRLRYNELDGIAVDQWPAEARDYAIKDAVITDQVFWAQETLVCPEGIPGENYQVMAAWALHLFSLWGVRTDQSAVSRLKTLLEKDHKAHTYDAMDLGYMRASGPKAGTRDMKAIRGAVQAFYMANRRPIPVTPGKNISTSRETLMATDDYGLHAVAECVRVGKVLTTYVPVLERGTVVPINCRYNPIIETFRTSCSKPNLQNPPRKGGVRECFVARAGSVFDFCDYDTLEMRTLAQICIDLFGYSFIADSIRAGRDLHVDFAADMTGIDYDQAFALVQSGDSAMKETRQFCKIANYGLAGGMGSNTLVQYAKNAKIIITLATAQKLYDGYRAKWREMVPYFSYCGSLCREDSARYVQFIRSNMIRGDVRYTSVCNGFFQHLAAMGAKDAAYRVTRECYVGVETDSGRPSALRGCRPWLFAHDEIGMENPYTGERGSAASYRLQTVMEKTMQQWCPDVPITASVAKCKRWYKGADPVIQDGILVPSKPVKIADKNGKEKTRWVADPY